MMKHWVNARKAIDHLHYQVEEDRSVSVTEV